MSPDNPRPNVEDREAAAALIDEYFQWNDEMHKLAEDYRHGYSFGPFVQAFMRHRLATESRLSHPEGGDARERARELLAEARGPFATKEHILSGENSRVVNIAAALRAIEAVLSLSSPPAGGEARMREALEKIADGVAFRHQRFAEDDDPEYFLRCQREVQKFARAALTSKES